MTRFDKRLRKASLPAVLLVIVLGVTAAAGGTRGEDPPNAAPARTNNERNAAPAPASSDDLTSAASAPAAPEAQAIVYEVHKKVSDFPDREDLSTPEAAYASMNRAWATQGDAVWPRLSVDHNRKPPVIRESLPKEQVEALLAAEILEVHVWENTRAWVMAREQDYRSKDLHVDVVMRWLQQVDGRWLNKGDDRWDTLEQARQRIARYHVQRQRDEIAKALQRQLDERPPIAEPESHLRPFVEFLQREGQEPRALVLDALGKHRVVILSEIHHRLRYWAFNADLVRSPEFARRVGVVFMELPSNDQSLVDGFLAASEYDPQPVIEMLRDVLWMGWPDQPMLDFFRVVWEVNRQLPEPQRLRIVLADKPQDWKEVKQAADWTDQYGRGRDEYMAESVVRDLRDHAADRRNALFLVGYGHAMLNLSRPGGEPIKSAGWHLREELGAANVFAIFPHGPIITNMGEVSGRLALGLFDTAFAALGNKPLAFPLDHGPFGEQIFDADPERLTPDPYRKGYDAYLYLGTLEDEVFSPLISGFYTDEFVQEVDRRMRLVNGKGPVEAGYVKHLDGSSFTAWMSRNSWGRPRIWSTRLGPLNAWQYGGKWKETIAKEKTQNWTNDEQEKMVIKQAAIRLFEAIRESDYENPGDWQRFPAPDVSYRVREDFPGWVKWVCEHFGSNPIVTAEIGEPQRQADGRPAVSYKLTLKDGAKLEGVLLLEYSALKGWFGDQGLDWHLR